MATENDLWNLLDLSVSSGQKLVMILLHYNIEIRVDFLKRLRRAFLSASAMEMDAVWCLFAKKISKIHGVCVCVCVSAIFVFSLQL